MRKRNWTRTKQLRIATRKAMDAAVKNRESIGWSEARRRGLRWCLAMWPEWAYLLQIPTAPSG